MRTLFFILIAIVLMSCNNDSEKIYLEVKDIELIDKGQISYEFSFSSLDKDSLINCSLRTLNIKKNDEIKEINASIKNKTVFIYVISTPYDFDCMDEGCFTVHDLRFNLIGISKGEYPVEILINGSPMNTRDYYISKK